MKKLILFLTLFGTTFMVWCEFDFMEEDEWTQDVDQQTEESVEIKDFDEVYTSMLENSMGQWIEDITQLKDYENIDEDLDIFVQWEGEWVNWNLNLQINSISENTKDYDQMSARTEIDFDWQLEINILWQSQNFEISWLWEILLSESESYAILNEFDYDWNDDGFLMFAEMIEDYKGEWIYFGESEAIEWESEHIEWLEDEDFSMSPVDFYIFVEEIYTLLEDNPVIQENNSEVEDNEIVYDVDLDEDNILNLYSDLMELDFLDLYEIDETEISQGTQVLQEALENLEFESNVIVDQEDNITMEIEEMWVEWLYNIEWKLWNEWELTLEDLLGWSSFDYKYDFDQDWKNFELIFYTQDEQEIIFDWNLGYNFDEKYEVFGQIDMESPFFEAELDFDNRMREAEEFDLELPENYQNLWEILDLDLDDIMWEQPEMDAVPTQDNAEWDVEMEDIQEHLEDENVEIEVDPGSEAQDVEIDMDAEQELELWE